MKFNMKLILLLLLLLVISNGITYKLAHDHTEMKDFFVQVKIDSSYLKLYDRNNTEALDIFMVGNINSVLSDAGENEDIDKYSSLCDVFDDNLFELVNKYNEINKKRYPDVLRENIDLQQLHKNIEKGEIKMKKLCNVQKGRL